MKNYLKLRNIILLLIIVLSYKKTYAQLPNSDATFSLVAIDNFTGTAINTSSWTPTIPWECHTEEVIFDPANISVIGGYCKLKVEDLRSSPITSCAPTPTTMNFRGAGMISTFKYKYGYYEISAKCPTGKGIGFAFWTLGDCATSGNYQEADIIEDGGLQSETGTIMGMNYHWGSGCNSNTNQLPYPFPEAIVTYSTTEHRIALFWEPDRVTWYFDDSPVYDFSTAGTNAAYIIFDIGIELGSMSNNENNIVATFPAYFELNYLKISQLKPDCNANEIFWGIAFNPLTYNYAVKKTVSLGGAACTAPSTINTSSNVSLWATDYILIDQGTTINDNSSGSFMAKITACPN